MPARSAPAPVRPPPAWWRSALPAEARHSGLPPKPTLIRNPPLWPWVLVSAIRDPWVRVRRWPVQAHHASC